MAGIISLPTVEGGSRCFGGAGAEQREESNKGAGAETIEGGHGYLPDKARAGQ